MSDYIFNIWTGNWKWLQPLVCSGTTHSSLLLKLVFFPSFSDSFNFYKLRFFFFSWGQAQIPFLSCSNAGPRWALPSRSWWYVMGKSLQPQLLASSPPLFHFQSLRDVDEASSSSSHANFSKVHRPVTVTTMNECYSKILMTHNHKWWAQTDIMMHVAL